MPHPHHRRNPRGDAIGRQAHAECAGHAESHDEPVNQAQGYADQIRLTVQRDEARQRWLEGSLDSDPYVESIDHKMNDCILHEVREVLDG